LTIGLDHHISMTALNSTSRGATTSEIIEIRSTVEARAACPEGSIFIAKAAAKPNHSVPRSTGVSKWSGMLVMTTG